MRLLTLQEEASGMAQGYSDHKYTGEEAGEIFEMVGGFEYPDRVATGEQHTLFFKNKDGSGYLYLCEHSPNMNHLSKLLVHGSPDGSGAEAAERLFEELVYRPDGLNIDECQISSGAIYPAN